MAVLGASSWAAGTLAEGVSAPLFNTDTWSYEEANSVFEIIKGSEVTIVNFSAQSNFWAATSLYMEFSTTNSFDAQTLFAFKNAAGVSVVEIRTTSSETYQIWTRSGGTLTLRATSAVQGAIAAPEHRYDAHVDIGASGSVTLYLNGTSVVTWSGDTSDGGAYTSCVKVEAKAEMAFSAILGVIWCLVTDDDSRSYRCHQVIPTGAGSNNDFTGTYAEVDDVRTTAPYTDVASGDTVGQKFSVAATDPLSAYSSGYDVVGVLVVNRARAGSGNPRIKPLIRHGGVEASGDTAALNPTDSAAKHLFTVNPSTGVAFTYSELADIEIGCEVVAPV